MISYSKGMLYDFCKSSTQRSRLPFGATLYIFIWLDNGDFRTCQTRQMFLQGSRQSEFEDDEGVQDHLKEAVEGSLEGRIATRAGPWGFDRINRVGSEICAPAEVDRRAPKAPRLLKAKALLSEKAAALVVL